MTSFSWVWLYFQILEFSCRSDCNIVRLFSFKSNFLSTAWVMLTQTTLQLQLHLLLLGTLTTEPKSVKVKWCLQGCYYQVSKICFQLKKTMTIITYAAARWDDRGSCSNYCLFVQFWSHPSFAGVETLVDSSWLLHQRNTCCFLFHWD